MQSKIRCVGMGLGLIVLFASIGAIIQFQSDILSWIYNSPLNYMIVGVIFLIDAFVILALISGLSGHPEAENCPFTFKGLSHSRHRRKK